MSTSVNNHRGLLEILANKDINKALKKAVVQHGPDSLIVCLCSCCHNILRGAVPMKKSHLLKLKKHRKFIHKVADVSTSAGRKRKYLKGAGVRQALNEALPLILNLVLEYFSHEQ